MINKLTLQPKTMLIFFIVIISIAFNFYASDMLNASYEQSQFPVPYFEAQLSFSADKIKAWYAFLIQQNTLDIYIKTQHIDFLFILSVLLLHFFVLVLISRLFPQTSRGRKILIICALLSIIAPLSDALENLISYIMLANPTGFSDWLAYVYSGFAAIKFVMFTFAYIAVAIGLIIGLFVFVRARLNKTI